MLDNLTLDNHASNRRGSHVYRSTVFRSSHENLEGDFLSDLNVLVIYVNNFSSDYLILFASDFNDGYHSFKIIGFF